jgi:hypothetical protein
MFKALGFVVAMYVAYAATKGEVYAKSGPWGRTVSRDESPGYFWTVIAVYALLAAALVFVF